VTRAAEAEGAVARAAETEDSSSDESEGEYLKVANEFVAKRAAAKESAAENLRRSFKADQDQGSKATQAGQAAEVSAGGHVKDKARDLRRRQRRRRRKDGVSNSPALMPGPGGDAVLEAGAENLLVSGSSSSALALVLGGDSPVFGSSPSALAPGLGGDHFDFAVALEHLLRRRGDSLVSGSSSSALVPGLRVDSLVSGSSYSALVPGLRGDSLVSGSRSSALVPGLRLASVELTHHQKTKVEVAHPKDKDKVEV